MMPAVPKKRLTFDDLDVAVAHARRLLDGGYERRGNWSLGQACDHLATFTRFSLDGFPGRGLPGPAQFVLRKLVINDVMLSRPMPRRMPTLRSLVPPSDADDAAGVEAFAGACRRFTERHEAGGPFADEPFFGQLSPDRWRQVHLLHDALHLGMLSPKP